MFRDLADLRADTVGAALREAGAARGRALEAVVEPIGEGGFLGTLARVRLRWDGEGPASVVAKLPTTVPANAEIVARFGYDRREAGVYRELRPWERAPAPRCLAQGWNEDAGRGWLLLEDLGRLRPGDARRGATDDEAVAVIEALAALHAAYWDDERLPGLDWLPDTHDPRVAGYGTIFDLTWDLCVERLGGVEPSVETAVREARARFDAAIEAFATGARTLVHGDARLDNARFGSDGAVLLDFQLAALGRGAYDVAFFCAGSLTTRDRRRLEPELLDRYRATLARHDIGVDPAALWHDYRLGHVLNLPNPVSALAVVEPTDERGAEFLRTNARRGLAAVADHVGLLEFRS